MRIAVNDQPLELQSQPSSYAAIHRKWKNGDRVDVEFPMSLRTESMPDNKNRIAIFYGPVLLAADLGPVNDPEATDPTYVPVLVTDGQPVASWVRTENTNSQTFVTDGVGKPRDVRSFHFTACTIGRYTVYLDVFTRCRMGRTRSVHSRGTGT